MSLLKSKLRPALALGDTGVDVLLDDGGAYATSGFDPFAFVVEMVGEDGLGAVFVGGYDLCW